MKDLYQCYGRPSDIKKSIYLDCVREAIVHNAYDYGITSYNCNFFTFCYKYYNENGQNVLHTKTKWRDTETIIE